MGRITLARTTRGWVNIRSLGIERIVVWGIPQCGRVDSGIKRNLRVKARYGLGTLLQCQKACVRSERGLAE